ncbi:hypothetical protein RyT2_00620 [Pseudolactococcus yaeyamensis]
MRENGNSFERFKNFYQKLLKKRDRSFYKMNGQLELVSYTSYLKTCFSTKVTMIIKSGCLEMTRRIKTIIAMEMLDIHLFFVMIEELYVVIKNII